MVVTDNKTASNVIPSERSDEESQKQRMTEIFSGKALNNTSHMR